MRWVSPEIRSRYRERFHKVIRSAGYSEEAAQAILARWLEEYLLDLREFDRMLAKYEADVE